MDVSQTSRIEKEEREKKVKYFSLTFFFVCIFAFVTADVALCCLCVEILPSIQALAFAALIEPLLVRTCIFGSIG